MRATHLLPMLAMAGCGVPGVSFYDGGDDGPAVTPDATTAEAAVEAAAEATPGSTTEASADGGGDARPDVGEDSASDAPELDAPYDGPLYCNGKPPPPNGGKCCPGGPQGGPCYGPCNGPACAQCGTCESPFVCCTSGSSGTCQLPPCP